MKKSINYLLFTICSLFVFVTSASAAGVCNSTTLYEEKVNASEMSVDYETVQEIMHDENSDPEYWDEYWIRIAIRNIPDNVIIKVDSMNGTFKSYELSSSERDETNTIYKAVGDVSKIMKYKFSIISTSDKCNGETLKSLTMTTPMFNELTSSQACSTYPDFKYCATFTDYDVTKVTSTTFNKSLEEYKASLEKKEEKKEEEGAITKAIKNNMAVIVVLVVVLVGILVTVIVIKKKRSSVIQ